MQHVHATCCTGSAPLAATDAESQLGAHADAPGQVPAEAEDDVLTMGVLLLVKLCRLPSCMLSACAQGPGR